MNRLKSYLPIAHFWAMGRYDNNKFNLQKALEEEARALDRARRSSG
jgi:hypothetical protein